MTYFRYHSSWCTENMLYIQMGYCESGTLMHLIKNRNGRKIEIFRIISYFCQLMEAVKHCHAEKLIHRDIKVRLVTTEKLNVIFSLIICF